MTPEKMHSKNLHAAAIVDANIFPDHAEELIPPPAFSMDKLRPAASLAQLPARPLPMDILETLVVLPAKAPTDRPRILVSLNPKEKGVAYVIYHLCGTVADEMSCLSSCWAAYWLAMVVAGSLRIAHMLPWSTVSSTAPSLLWEVYAKRRGNL